MRGDRDLARLRWMSQLDMGPLRSVLNFLPTVFVQIFRTSLTVIGYTYFLYDYIILLFYAYVNSRAHILGVF